MRSPWGASAVPQEGISAETPRVLVVEDDSRLAEVLGRTLEENGFKVTCKVDAPSAISALKEDRFDLVITDIYLGEGGLGHEVARAASQGEDPVPVILLTGHPSMDSAVEGLRSGVVDYVTKPITAETLTILARRTVEDARLRRHNRFLREVNGLLASLLPNAIEAKDPTTRGHSERVVLYADRLAVLCGVNQSQREKLKLAALLHDVGKIGVPETILTKPGPLDREERRRIQQHPEIGYRILEPLESPAEIRTWVYQHHERWDGRGYPCGLRGEEVALPGRILIVAEVYDALATARSYKAPWPAQAIAELMEAESGRHFDPEVAAIVADGLRREGMTFLGRDPGNLL